MPARQRGSERAEGDEVIAHVTPRKERERLAIFTSAAATA